MSLAYPGAYPLEKTDELVKAVWAKAEARASSHFSVESGKTTKPRENEREKQGRRSRRKESMWEEVGKNEEGRGRKERKWSTLVYFAFEITFINIFKLFSQTC